MAHRDVDVTIAAREEPSGFAFPLTMDDLRRELSTTYSREDTIPKCLDGTECPDGSCTSLLSTLVARRREALVAQKAYQVAATMQCRADGTVTATMLRAFCDLEATMWQAEGGGRSERQYSIRQVDDHYEIVRKHSDEEIERQVLEHEYWLRYNKARDEYHQTHQAPRFPL